MVRQILAQAVMCGSLYLLLLGNTFLLSWGAPLFGSWGVQSLNLPTDTAVNESLETFPFGLNQTTDKTKLFKVPGTYISIIYEPIPEKRIDFRVLVQILNDTTVKVNRRLTINGNVDLPDDEDPYVNDTFAGPGTKGGYLLMQSPNEGPAHGRRLTWGNLCDVLMGLNIIMLKQVRGLPSRVDFQIRLDHVGVIGWGELSPGFYLSR